MKHEKLIIPLKQARKILGSKSKQLTDEQLTDIICSLESVAEKMIRIKKVPEYK